MKHKSILSERKITKEKTYLEYTIHRRWPRSPESNGRKQHKPITMVPSMSNHDGAIVADSDIIYAYNKKLFVWSQTKWSKIKEDALSFTEDFRNTYNESSVGDNWNKIKRCINDSLTSHVPVKTSPGKQINSWITYELRWKTRKKTSLVQEGKGYQWSSRMEAVPGRTEVEQGRDIQGQGQVHQWASSWQHRRWWHQVFMALHEIPTNDRTFSECRPLGSAASCSLVPRIRPRFYQTN